MQYSYATNISLLVSHLKGLSIMILEDDTKLLHREFHSDTRLKLSFSNFPSLYVHVDTMGELNVDTRFAVKELRHIIEGMFSKLYNEHFEPLTLPKLLEAAKYPEAMRMQYAQLRWSDGNALIIVRYGDKEESYRIPAALENEFPINVEDIPKDIVS